MIATKSCLTNEGPNREDAVAQAMRAPDSRIEITVGIKIDRHRDQGIRSERSDRDYRSQRALLPSVCHAGNAGFEGRSASGRRHVTQHVEQQPSAVVYDVSQQVMDIGMGAVKGVRDVKDVKGATGPTRTERSHDHATCVRDRGSVSVPDRLDALADRPYTIAGGKAATGNAIAS